jgi:phage terminase large subunit GpA-like protein
MSLNLDELERRARAALRPPPRLSLSDWIEANITLPAGASSVPGRVRLWPYQREIADAISDPTLSRVTLVKSARVGYTLLLSSAIAHFTVNDPSPILVLQPTESDARDYMVSDLEAIFSASPSLRGLLEDADEGERNTILHRRFPGGSLKVVAAKSPRNLRRHTARILFVDEADAMETSAEGSPIALAEKRTLSFESRKIVVGSTPLLEATSNVLRAYAASDQRVFEVPCPACGAFAFIQWRNLEWEPNKPETAAFRCPHCSELIDERHKIAMIERGRFRATRPEVRGHAGFKLNALTSPLPNASWANLVEEFLRAKDDPDLLRPFVNTILAEPWRDAEEVTSELELQSRAEPFGLDSIPAEVLAVTVGVDVQDDRIEATVVGWSRDEAFVLGHVVLWGSPDEGDAWRQLDELLSSRWRHPLGGWLGVDAAVIDSGFATDGVYDFCRPRLARRVWAGKGAPGSRPALQASKGKVKGVRLFIVGVDGIKDSLFAKLSRGRGVRFSDSLPECWYEQVLSERRVTRYSRGQPIRCFERIPGRAAEGLDCLVYAHAARAGLTIDWSEREARLRSAEPPRAPSRVVRSRWLDAARLPSNM